jgi:uncharacterized repeat protein (TIGR03803 family)
MPAASTLPATGQPTTSSSNFQTLYVFAHLRDGIVPVGTLLGLNGSLYGATNFGGYVPGCRPQHGCGTVFEISSPGEETVLYRFKNDKTGSRPYAGLIDVKGTLYGTTQTGGKHNEGTVFAITTSGSESVICEFDGKNGNNPRAGLTSVDGALYGTTYDGGSADTGTIFTVTASGAEKVLHSLTGGKDGALPLGTLLDVNKVLYGTTSVGGTSDRGTVFEISPTGSNYKVLYSFKGKGDGAYPFAGLTELNGTLYGTTQQGGAHKDGTIFAITPSGSESVLYSFGGGSGDGSEPFAGVTVLNGQLYGTTAHGGPQDDGTIFSLTPSGSEAVLHSFTGGAGGRLPYANLTAMGGALYGTTMWGGHIGTVFEYSFGTFRKSAKR